MPKRRFHGFNPQVYIHFNTKSIPVHTALVIVRTSTY
jgi:hypothetical protein